MRQQTDLHDPGSFDHVGRDTGAEGFVAGRVLADLAQTDDRIVCGTADLTWVTKMSDFLAVHPDRFFQFGISERNMISAAAGMAASGLRPYVSTFASFSAILAFEQIRTDLAYPALPARILATHAGIAMGYFGTSHHATEDIAALRSVAGLTIISPADANETEAWLRSTVDHPEPIYFRLGRGREPVIYPEVPSVTIGQPSVLREGPDVALVGTGLTVGESIVAADRLAEAGIEATVVNVSCLKPLDRDLLARQLSGVPAVVVSEEHNIEGGLGTIVQECLAERGMNTPVFRHGLRDEYGIVGPPAHLYRYYGIDAAGIAVVAERVTSLVAAGQFFNRENQAIWNDRDRAAVMESVAQSRRG